MKKFLIILAGGLVPLTASLPAKAQSAQARKAYDYVNSIGVCTKLSDYPKQYSNFEQVKALLGDLGVKHIRDAVHQNDQALNCFRTLNGQYGITVAALVGVTGPAQSADPNWYFDNGGHLPEYLDRLRTGASYLSAVEGCNEPDYSRFIYGGVEGIPAARTFQGELFQAVKNDPALRHLPVLSYSLAYQYDTTKYALEGTYDFVSLHHYPGNMRPSMNTAWSLIHVEKATGTGSRKKRVIATESGYHNALNASGWKGTSEQAAGKYTTRHFAEFMLAGITRTYRYQLYDTDDPGKTDQEKNWGIVRYDGTPKPSYYAIKNQIALLKDEAGAGFTAGSLNYTLSTDGSVVHHLLLQKSDGSFYLMLWQEVDSYNINTQASIDNGTKPATLTFGSSIDYVATYLPLNSTNEVQRFTNPTSVTLDVPDHAVIVKIVPRKALAGGVYELKPACAPTRNLDVNGASTADGANVALWSDNNQFNQRWKITDVGGGYYKLQPQHTTGNALDVSQSGNTSGTNVQSWTDNGSNAQRWKITEVDGGYYKLQPACAPTLCLDVSGSANADNANVQIWTDNGSNAQKWKLELAGTSARVATFGETLPENDSNFTLSPNPAADKFVLSYYSEKEQTAEVMLLNLVGQPLQESAMRLKAGLNRLVISTEAWSDGVCLVVLRTEAGKRAVKKLLIQH